MIRTAVAFLLISNVLICPLRCGGQFADSIGSQLTRQSCSCCSEPVEPEKKAPTPASEDSCVCFCNAAFLQGCKVEAGDLLAHDSSIPLPASQTDAVSVLSFSSSGLTFSHFPPHSTGREIRTLTRALLI